MSNQVDQMYVLTGQHQIKKVSKTKDGYVYFTYEGPGGLMRSDLIKPSQVMSWSYTSAESQRMYLHDVTVTVDETKLVVGEDYQIKIVISQFQDMAEDSLYYKYGIAHCGKDDTAETIAARLVDSLKKNFSREITKFFEFEADGAKIIIKELAQDWNLGLMPKQGVNFSVYVDEVIIDGVAEKWGTVEKVASTTRYIGNGYTLADMEYFYMGERGDQYRMFAAPQHRIPTKLLVDPTQEYNALNIHYYFVDSLGGVQKSEKDLVLIYPVGTEPEGFEDLAGELEIGN